MFYFWREICLGQVPVFSQKKPVGAIRSLPLSIFFVPLPINSTTSARHLAGTPFMLIQFPASLFSADF
jgi:hypothetical protein